MKRKTLENYIDMKQKRNLVAIIIQILITGNILAQNPIITNQFTADPTARVFDGKVYLYPSHDIIAPPDKSLRKDWFCMEDYHVFSSANLTEWTDHGVIVSQNKVKWVKPDSYSMWAPDCIEKNGKYYFFFPAPASDTIFGKGFSIGVAVADNPTGPFIPEIIPIKGVHGIDPCVFIDKDGQVYLYWAMGNLMVAKLNDNMTELASKPLIIDNLPQKGLKEGPFVFERNGIYYLTYPHVQNKTECLEYAVGNSPMGPFTVAGVIMDESPVGCWTNHQSFINFKDQWYLFYHHNDLSPKFDKNRSVMIDSMFFNPDGTIQKVKPGLRGVGLTNAMNEIDIDRYSRKSETGVRVSFLDSLDTFNGWKSEFTEKNAWIQYNAVDFENQKLSKLRVKVLSTGGGSLLIRADGPEGPLLSEVKIPKSPEWIIIEAKVSKPQTGVHNLLVILADGSPIEVDWIKFEK